MDNKNVRRGQFDLNLRETEILRSVLKAHVLSGEPVGSRTVSKGLRMDLSPATIRSIMSDLEDRGLLCQPHTSAGRVPTEGAYRFYVDRLMRPPRLQRSRVEIIDAALHDHQGEITDLLEEASRQLSRFSGNVGIVLAPELNRIVVEKMEFVRVAAGRVVAILVGRSGVVHNRLLELGGGWSQADLDQMGAYLSEQFSGCTLPEMHHEVQRRLREDRASLDRLKRKSMQLGEKAVEGGEGSGAIFVDGTSNLLDSPEFADVRKMKSLFKALDEKKRLVDLLGNVLDGEGVQVTIGRENNLADLKDCALVASPYQSGNRAVGTVGIVGPTRMEYVQVIALVDHLARVLTRFLSGDEPEAAST
ncbi:MAG: heat-inducible transcription repressor HrcA [Acidobacteria bacterium]|uniref:Heat-inducible transcription repressor HrcA n=1 Tax=Candidatus Polarisedimenticola svalbardensis TaxID=2886004 RepID=A0A8J7CCL9_9BACT|nr:heat-inducible transcription repressor HrcA [Candidatus Polarisedimenticola svalbardensis]